MGRVSYTTGSVSASVVIDILLRAVHQKDSETVPVRRVRDGPWEVDVLYDGATHVDG